MEYDCHIFSKYLVFQMKDLVFQSKYLVFRLETLDFDRNTRYFESEIPAFSHLEFEILGISSKIHSISKKVWNTVFLVDFMYVF